MTTTDSRPNPDAMPSGGARSSIPFATCALVILFLTLVPFRIVSSGFLPGDDALRHAAKAVSGRDWSEVLVLRPEITMDSHPGWHALLGVAHRVAA